MAKRKGPSTSSRPRARDKAAKVGSEAKTSEGGGVEDECDQLRREFRPLERKRAEILEKVHELKAPRLDQRFRNLEENQQKLNKHRGTLYQRKRKWEGDQSKLPKQRRRLDLQISSLVDKQQKLDEQRRKLELQRRDLGEELRLLRLEEEQLQQNLLPKRPRLNELCSAREAENTQRLDKLDKLPKELWEQITDELENDDLFPLALSCRYFRRKQKELVTRTRQRGKPPLALKTNLRDVWNKSFTGQPMSAEYLRFCNEENVPSKVAPERAKWMWCLAAFYGNLPLLQELLKRRRFVDQFIAMEAARGGQMETLQWLMTQKGVELGASLFEYACKGGNLDVLKWLRSEGCPWDWRACREAAKGGHFEVLKWLRSKGCPWYEETCDAAAEGGHLEVLKWLRSEGCPWDVLTCSSAALGGHWDVLRWAVDNGCPYRVSDRTRPAYESLGLI